MTKEDVEMFYKQAMTYLAERDIKKAIEFFNRALEIDQMYLPAWNDLGVAFLELEDYKQAQVCFKRVVFLEPGVPISFYNLGYVEMMLEKYQDSVETFEIFLENYPQKNDFYKYALYMKAKGHYNLKEYEDAQKLLEKAIKKDKTFKDARDLYIKIMNESKKTN
jgi:lipoprotein NlpI